MPFKTILYADGAAMVALGLGFAAYTGYHLVKDIYDEYESQTGR